MFWLSLAVLLVALLQLSTRNQIMATQDQIDALAAAVGDVSDSLSATGEQLTKGQAEIVTEVQALKDQIAAGQTAPDFSSLDAKVAALSGVAAALKAQAQSLDDMNPDPVTP